MMSCNVVFDFVSPHNGEYWYKCTTCGAQDWCAYYDKFERNEPLRDCKKGIEKLTNTADYKDFRSRKGKFVLDRELITDDYKSVMHILSTVLVIRAENDFMTNAITYWAYSDHFEHIAEGLAAPEYEAIITKQENATDVVTWRIKE
jgi:hypothetical protein